MNDQHSLFDMSPPFEGRWWLQLENAENAKLIDMLRPALVSFLAFGKGREPKIAGSGFIISADEKLAVIITAKDVLEEGVSRAQFERPTHAPSTPAIFRPAAKISLERGRVRAVWMGQASAEMLTVPYVNFADELDLAVCLLLPQDDSTALEPSVIPLDTAIPKRGEVVHLVSLANKHPDERQYDPKSGLQEIAIERQVVVRRGIVTAVYMEGYRQFRWPCFTVSIPTAPGMSGGFVSIPQDGQTIAACGVVCADVSPHGAESSFLNRGESVIAISSSSLLLSIPEAVPWKAGNPSMTFPSVPNVPTFIESGLPGYAVTSWYGLALPAGTPAPIVEKITKGMQQVLGREKVREQITQVGALPKSSTPEELRKHIESEIQRWQQVRETAGIQQQ